MKKAFRISVNQPCSENFINFKKTELGGHCNRCQKEVIDFTQFSDLDIARHFTNDNEKTCGRFRTSQLKNYEFDSVNNMNTNLFSRTLGIASFSLLALCATAPILAQETGNSESDNEIVVSSDSTVKRIIFKNTYNVRGTVLDESNLPIPGVNVVLKGTSEGTSTDYDGKFEFPRKLEVNDVLVFSYIGYDTKEYKVKESTSETIDITIVFDATDIELMGDVVVGGAYKSKRNIFQKFIALFK